MNYEFSDLVDIQHLQRLMQAFYEVTGLIYAILDVRGNILGSTGWRDICIKFHRACPQTEFNCRKSDSYIFRHLHEESFVGYQCLNGLMDYASPIIVEGRHLATLFTGQLLHEPPDEEFFRRQGRAYGFDETAYIEALRRVPIIPKERVESVMRFYAQLVKFLAILGLEKKRQLEAANQAIQEREERLRLILETCHDGFWDWNIETGYMYYSPRCFEMLGYSPEGFAPCFPAEGELVHTDDMTAITQILKEHLAGQTKRYEAEYRLLTGSGEWKWVLNRGKVVTKNERGQPLRMAGTLLDITERKRAEEALQKMSAELDLQVQERTAELVRANEALQETLLQQKALLNSIPDIAWLKDQESRLIAVNQPYGQACGLEPDELEGKTDLDIWPKELAEKYLADDRQVIISGQMKQVEELLIDRRGCQTWLETIKVPILNEHGCVIGTAGIARDITDRRRLEDELKNHRHRLEELVRERTRDLEKANKGFQKEILDRQRAEEALKTEHLRLFSLLERMPVFITLIAPDYSIVFANKIIRENFGALKGSPCYKNFHGLNAPCEDCPKAHLRETSNPIERERTAANGNTYHNYYFPFSDIDGSLLTLIFGIDITEQKRFGKEIARLDRLNLVGEMAAGIGHEIRNPMTTVRGFLQMLREKDGCTQYKDYFNLMIDELDRANSIITEYLSLAKNKPVELKRQNLNKIVSVILPLITADALITDKYIEMELADIPKLLLDEKEIRQLILNLVRNGLEAMSPGGRLLINTFAEGDEVVLAIRDHGKGIKPDVLEKIGTPFYTTKENGTGLGLAVCYSIASRHNAAINVETGPGGTTFYVRFKAKREVLSKQITMQTQPR